MKITRISIYQVDLPMKEGSYSWSTQSFSAFDSTVVAIETDEGITGYGETCPLGPSYLAAYAEGARTGIAKIAPRLARIALGLYKSDWLSARTTASTPAPSALRRTAPTFPGFSMPSSTAISGASPSEKSARQR